MRLNIPPIIRQMNSIMMPSIPLVSRPLVKSHRMPTKERTTNRPQMRLSSIQFDFGFVGSIRIVDEVIALISRKSSCQEEAEYGLRSHASAILREHLSARGRPTTKLGAKSSQARERQRNKGFRPFLRPKAAGLPAQGPRTC